MVLEMFPHKDQALKDIEAASHGVFEDQFVQIFFFYRLQEIL